VIVWSFLGLVILLAGFWRGKVRILDLFSGIGGFSLGLQAAGMETAAFCECEDHAIRVLNKNFSGIPVSRDIRGLNSAWLIENQISGVELICGGFPCQDVSIAGKRAGIENGEKSGLWREFKRVIADIKPKYAVIENVQGLLSRGLDTVLSDLAKIGYDATWTTIDSQFCGVPQRRRRVYILAVRDGVPPDADIFRFEQRCNSDVRSKMEHIQKGRPWNFEAREGFGQSFAYFARQRSDKFDKSSVSSTLAKRDYKSYTDLIVTNNLIRRVTPQERLKLQGFPSTFFDECGLTDSQMFSLNGMTIGAVKWVGECIMEFDRTRAK
jgi:site-specific DNA-cytosine methylase